MVINGIKYHRLYIRIDQIFIFEKLMIENNIKVINEKELHTNVNSSIFYVKEVDIDKIDEICIKHNIDLNDDFSNIPDERFWLQKLPKTIRVLIQIIIFIIIIYFIFNDYL